MGWGRIGWDEKDGKGFVGWNEFGRIGWDGIG